MIFYQEKGLWNRDIPTSVSEFRRQVIRFMVDNRDRYVSRRIVNGVNEDPPLDETTFESLIAQQSRENEWTDSDGFFVSAVCIMYDVELHIVDTSVQTVQIINQSETGERIKFSVGLIKNSYDEGGHIQFIYHHPDGEHIIIATHDLKQ